MNWSQQQIWTNLHYVIPEGHVPMYSRGQRYARCVLEALTDDQYRVADVLEVAEKFIGPLIDVSEPDDLRDFIAGLASGFERAATSRMFREDPLA